MSALSTTACDSLVGTVWRKDGPCGWLRVVDECFTPGSGIPGVSVQFRSMNGRWIKQRWFITYGTREQFIDGQQNANRYLEVGEQR